MTGPDLLRRAGEGSRRVAARWRGFWFRPAPPLNLGLCRALFFGLILIYFLRSDFSVYGGPVYPAFWRPTWASRRLLPFGPQAEHTIAVVQAAWKVALALACVGLLSRLAAGAACVLSLYLLGLPYNFGLTSHMTAPVVFVCGILSLARSGDACSLDAVLRNRRRRGADCAGVAAAPPAAAPAAATASGEYTWPVRLVWVLLSLVFFGAGVSKLRHSGLAWAASDTFERLLRMAHHPAGPATPPLTRWGLSLAAHPLFCRAMAAGTLFFETGYPLALVGPRLRAIFAGSMVVMLACVRLLLGPPFELLIICHLFWVPWDRVAAALRRPPPAPAPAPAGPA